MSGTPDRLSILLSESEISERVRALAERLAPRIDDQTVAVCLLTGGLWFAADLTRALARLDRHVAFDALWPASYGDERASAVRRIDSLLLAGPVWAATAFAVLR